MLTLIDVLRGRQWSDCRRAAGRAGLVLVGLVMTACAGGGETSAGDDGVAARAAAIYALTFGDPFAPLDDADLAQLVEQEVAREQAIERCMAERGFDYAVPDRDAIAPMFVSPEISGGDPVRNAQRNGFGISVEVETPAESAIAAPPLLDEAEQAAYDEALLGSDGCFGLARDDQAAIDAVLESFDDAALQTFRRYERDPRVARADADIADCLRAAGFTEATRADLEAAVYQRLEAVETDRQLVEVQAWELAAAVAVAECELVHGGIRDEVLAELRAEFDAEHRSSVVRRLEEAMRGSS